MRAIPPLHFLVLLSASLLGAGAAQASSPRVAAWGEDEIRASRVIHEAAAVLPARPAFTADPLNLLLIFGAQGRGLTILDGDRLEPLHRMAWRGELAGPPQFSPDGRFAYLVTRDGWLGKFDLWSFRTVAEVRAGLDTRNAALSADGRFLAVANAEPRALALFDDALELAKLLPARNAQNTQDSRVASVVDAAPRLSFVALLEDAPEVWEISYNPKAEDIPAGVIHDFQYREGAFVRGFLNPRRTLLEERIDAFILSRDANELVAARRGADKAQVVHLDVRRRIASLALRGEPLMDGAAGWIRGDRPVLAIPNRTDGSVTIVDLREWKVLQEVGTAGPGNFVRSHPRIRHAVIHARAEGDAGDALEILDKTDLRLLAQLRPAPGMRLRDIEFERHGRIALVGIDGAEGVLVAYDTSTWTELKRLSVQGAVGKYSVFNRIKRPDGTPH